MDPLVLNHFAVLESSLEELRSDIQIFIDGPAASCYIENKGIDAKIGLRKSHHYLDFAIYTTLDVTSLCVGANFKTMGAGAKIIKVIRSINPYAGIFLYNMLDQRLTCYLIKQGWNSQAGNLYTITKNAQEGHL